MDTQELYSRGLAVRNRSSERSGREAHGRARRIRRTAAEHDQRLRLRRRLVAPGSRARIRSLVVSG